MLRIQNIRLMLREIMERDTVADHSAAGIRRKGPGEHLEQGALAGSVFADQRYPLASLHEKI